MFLPTRLPLAKGDHVAMPNFQECWGTVLPCSQKKRATRLQWTLIRLSTPHKHLHGLFPAYWAKLIFGYSISLWQSTFQHSWDNFSFPKYEMASIYFFKFSGLRVKVIYPITLFWPLKNMLGTLVTCLHRPCIYCISMKFSFCTITAFCIVILSSENWNFLESK